MCKEKRRDWVGELVSWRARGTTEQSQRAREYFDPVSMCSLKASQSVTFRERMQPKLQRVELI